MIAATVHCLCDTYWYSCMFIYCSLSIWGLLKVYYIIFFPKFPKFLSLILNVINISYRQ